MVQLLVIGLTAFSAFFFSRGVMVASPEVFAELSRARWDYNLSLVKTFSGQKADTVFGFSFLIASIILQMFPLIKGTTWDDLGGLSLKVATIIVIFLSVVFLTSLKFNKYYAQNTESKILVILGADKIK